MAKKKAKTFSRINIFMILAYTLIGDVYDLQNRRFQAQTGGLR